MTSVRLALSSVLHDITGAKELELDLNQGSTVKDLFDTLFEKYGADFRRRILDPKTGDLRRFIIVIVNGRDIRHMNQMETELKEGDEVAILPAVAGG
ncbi:MAG: ubiquitin-like small modifier protein 1 [Candidatus Geothermarchaeales archaeon]